MNQHQVHLILQGKGGVGKSLIAAILAQYFQHKAGQVQPFDTDPVNDTLSQYAAFATTRVDILDARNHINARAFDGLIEAVLLNDQVCVIDNGASTFVPLMAYMVENRVVELLEQAGKHVYIHSVVTGGQAFPAVPPSQNQACRRMGGLAALRPARLAAGGAVCCGGCSGTPRFC